MKAFDLMTQHIQNLRNSVPDPSEETLAAWQIEDLRHELIEEAAAQDDDDDPSFAFESEVKIR